MLGGEISLQSQVGIGTIFRFWIPLQFKSISVDKTPPEPKTIALILDDSIKVLVAEDDNINFLLLQKILKSEKIAVVRAVDGQQAIDICKENSNFDMIFMDIRMPNKNGHEAYEAIRKFNLKIPIVAQTSYSFPEEIEKISPHFYQMYEYNRLIRHESHHTSMYFDCTTLIGNLCNV